MLVKELLDKRRKLKKKLDDLNLDVKKVVSEIREVEGDVSKYLKDNKLNKWLTDTDKVHISNNITPNIVNWEMFCGYVFGTGNFDLIQKKVNQETFVSMCDNGELPPGVEINRTEKLKFSKR